MKDKKFAEVYRTQFLGRWTKMNAVRKPIIGAVSGYAVSKLSLLCSRALLNTLHFSLAVDVNWQ